MYFTLKSHFRAYYEKANAAPGVTGELLIQQLERRLDSVAFRLGFATSAVRRDKLPCTVMWK